jgi:hypothetical protein
MRKVVITTVLGGHDYPKDPLIVAPDWEYLMFTDDPSITSDVWQVIPVTDDQLQVGTPRALSRRIKIMTHEFTKFDVCLWVDGSMTLLESPETLLATMGEAPLLLKIHPNRDTITSEVDACVQTGRMHAQQGEDWLAYCAEQGYTGPVQDKGQIYETGLYMKRNTSATFELMREWWRHTSERTQLRDQLSLPFVLWKQRTPMRFFGDGEYEAWVHPTKHTPQLKPCYEVARWVQPFAIDGNLGRAYNESAEGLDDDEWIAVMDQDICMLDSRLKYWIGQCLAEHEDKFDVFVPVTNRLSDSQQLVEGMYFTHDIRQHRNKTKHRWDAFGTSTVPTTKPTAGMLMVMKVRTLRTVRFRNGIWFIDTDFYRRAESMGYRFGLMRGIYVFHYYRLCENKSSAHLHRAKW